MARFTEQLRDWLARVEILARGAEQHRLAAVRGLAAGQPAEARHHALAILDELPRSRVALALWAEAAEAMLLDEEAVESLERLVREVPFRADVWYRVAQARQRLEPTGPSRDTVREALERAVEAEEPTSAADAALLWLAERDLRARDPARAERWIGRISLAGRESSEVRRCLAAALLDQGESERAVQTVLGLAPPSMADEQGWLVHARLLAFRDPESATAAFARALLLGADGAGRVVSRFIEQGAIEDADRFRPLVESLGEVDRPWWRAAFAFAAGQAAEAVAALAVGVREDSDPELLLRYAHAAVEARVESAVSDAMGLARERGVDLGAAVNALAEALNERDPARRLDTLDRASVPPTAAWASALRSATYREWLPRDGFAQWAAVLREVEELGRQLGALGVLRETEALARELERPLRVAVVGEFNAGKSSFINALIGEEVAPVGVLPTTATVNRVAWAADRFARIVLRHQEQDRVVAHSGLRAALREVGAPNVEEVVIYAPLEPLRRVELIDTPGFNAPDAAHSRTAREAFSEAHVALWLLDAAQPLKDSERDVLREIARVGVPLVVVVNKVDRLPSAEAQTQVLEHVKQGLREAELQVETDPIGFSARLALAGQRGDRDAARASNWGAVDELVERLLVSRSAPLRERALRRRAQRIVRRLVVTAEELDAQHAAAAVERAKARRRALATLAAVRASRREIAEVVRGELQGALEVLGRDVKLVVSEQVGKGRFLSGRARRIVGHRVAQAALEYCDGRLGELSPELQRRYHERVELAAAVAAPWLVQEVLGHAGHEEHIASEQVVQAALDELAAVTEQGALGIAEPPPNPACARAPDLASALSATGVSP